MEKSKLLISSISNFPFTSVILLNVLIVTPNLNGLLAFKQTPNSFSAPSSLSFPPEIRVSKWISVEESDYYYDAEETFLNRNWKDIDASKEEQGHNDAIENDHPLKSGAIQISGFGSHEYTISRHVKAVQFECRAPYPIQWTFHDALYVTADLHGIQMRTFRHSKSVTDPRNDIFTAVLEISMESNRATGNYSCVTTSQQNQEHLKSDIFIYWEGTGSSPPYLVLAGKMLEIRVGAKQESVIFPCYVSSPNVKVRLLKEIVGSGEFKEIHATTLPVNEVLSQFDPKIGFQLSFQNASNVLGRYRCEADGNNDEDDDVMEIVLQKGNEAMCEGDECFQSHVSPGTRFYFDEKTEELVCCGRKGSVPRATRLHTIFCANPSTCSMYEPALFMSSGSNGKRSLNGSCVSERIYPRDYGLARCQGEGIDVFTYVYTEFWTPEQENLRAVFDWKDINPQNMIHIMIHAIAPYYNHQLVTATCQTLHSYFSDGIKWSIKWSNGSLTYFDSILTTQSDPSLHGIRSTYLRLNLQMTEIICYAPVWNSSQWIEKSLKIDVRPSKVPTIRGSSVEEFTFALNDTEKILECTSHAQPPAKIKWTRNDEEVPRSMVIWNENGTSVLLFKTVSYATHAVYKCIAKNEVGQARKIFRIFVEDTRHSTWSLAFAIVIPVLVTTFFAISAFLIWRMKTQGKVVEHLTRVVFRDSNNHV